MRSSRAYAVALVAAVAATLAQGAGGAAGLRVQEYPVPPGTHPHDVAPAPDGTVWYTAQATGSSDGLTRRRGRRLRSRSGPGGAARRHRRPDGAAWVTDGGLNAIVRVEPGTHRLSRLPAAPSAGSANLNTATFDKRGILWFTGQSGTTAA